MATLIALRSFGKYSVGEEFQAEEKFAKILVLMGRAKRKVVEEEQPQLLKRTYRRRDMTAQ